MLLRENADDAQGLGVFARFGYAHANAHMMTRFYSVGGQYTGLIPSRDDDVLGFGVACGLWHGGQNIYIQKDYATEMELYYSIAVTPWLTIAPSVQYIWNPGIDLLEDATVIGVRAQLAL